MTGHLLGGGHCGLLLARVDATSIDQCVYFRSPKTNASSDAVARQMSVSVPSVDCVPVDSEVLGYFVDGHKGFGLVHTATIQGRAA